MSSMSIDRNEYPGKTDAEIAEILAKKYGFIAVIRYKNVRESTEFTDFGTCQTEEEIQRYLNTPYEPELVYDGRANCGMGLMQASEEGHFEVVLTLLANGANIHQEDEDGWTALTMASQNGHIQIVKVLLAKGADVNSTAKNGTTPLIQAAMGGDVNTVRTLLTNGANVNATTTDGWTALIGAAKFGHAEVIHTLLASGANINARSGRGYTALSIASRFEHSEVVKLLLAKGADAAALAEVTTQQEDRERFVASYRKVRDASEMTRMEIIEKVCEEGTSIPKETALIWAKSADLEDGLIFTNRRM